MVNDMVIENSEPSPQQESGDASKSFNVVLVFSKPSNFQFSGISK
jgi:hypothetical protein